VWDGWSGGKAAAPARRDGPNHMWSAARRQGGRGGPGVLPGPPGRGKTRARRRESPAAPGVRPALCLAAEHRAPIFAVPQFPQPVSKRMATGRTLRPWAALAALLLLAGQTLAGGLCAPCGTESGCSPCGTAPAGDRLVARCCCCADLSAPKLPQSGQAESVVEVKAPHPGAGVLLPQLHPLLSQIAADWRHGDRRTCPSAVGPPLYCLNQSLLI